MRSVGLPKTNNKKVARNIFVVSSLLLFSACSPLSSRLDETASAGGVYPLSDSFITGSISSSSRLGYAPSSRRVTRQSLAPIEEYSANEPAEITRENSNDGVVIVRSGDSLLGVAREHGVDAVDLAEINSLEAPYSLKVGEELVLPGSPAARKMASSRDIQPRIVVRKQAVVKNKKTRTVAIPVARPKNIRTVKVVTPHKKVALQSLKKKTTKKPVKIARIKKTLVRKKPEFKAPATKKTLNKRQASAENQFRWPIRGRVISEFGKKANGTKNDGINLSVPTGAAIVASESGTVVYSGNELKGFGNLVLIRHKNGWSTAYAHVSKMLVKKGQKVRRGQVIAKAGQTGSVSRPQLHFEIRRGTTPVNPRKILTGTKVALR